MSIGKKIVERLALSFVAMGSFPAHALPLPELTGAAVGVWEVIVACVALAGVALPWLGWFKPSRRSVGITLLASLAANVCFFGFLWSQPVSSKQWAREDRPGMIWSEQERQRDSHAISEQEAYALMQGPAQTRAGYVFLDARSPGERAVGTAAGFEYARWPDVVDGALGNLEGKTVVAACWTGMRGSEACSKLEQAGISCKYLKAGLDGWSKSGYPVALNQGFSLADFGAIEQFPNAGTMLGPAQAAEALSLGAIVVDARSEREFLAGSINGAYSIPIEELPQAMVQYKIGSLPPKPVVVACFGYASCPMADAVGWELWRIGGKYAGAYAGGQAALDKAMGKSSEASKILSEKLFDWGASKILSLCGPQWGLVAWGTLLSMFAALGKFSAQGALKRSSLRRRAAKLSVTAANGDAIRQARARAAKAAESWKDLAWSLGSLVSAYGLYAGSMAAADAARGASGFGYGHLEAVAGLGALSLVASILVAAAIGAMVAKMKMGFVHVLAWGVWMGVVGIVAFPKAPAASTVSIASASACYVLGTLLVAAKVLCVSFRSRMRRAKGWDSLFCADHWLDPNGKAGRLAVVARSGLNVPQGIVFSPSAFDALSPGQFERICARLGPLIAVRSSALGEDSAQSSQAGLRLTIAPSTPAKSWADGKKVLGSYCESGSGQGACVLFQYLIDPVISGALFSRHPMWGGCALCEWGPGLGCDRMDGSAQSHSGALVRSGGDWAWLSDSNPDALVPPSSELWRALSTCEQLFSCPIDMEWAWDGAKLWVLQARPQTALDARGLSKDAPWTEKIRMEAIEQFGKGRWRSGESAESLPACARFSSLLAQRSWSPGAEADQAARSAGYRWLGSEESLPFMAYFLGRSWDSSRTLLGAPGRMGRVFGDRLSKELESRAVGEFKELSESSGAALSIDWGSLDNASWAWAWRQAVERARQARELALVCSMRAKEHGHEAEKFLDSLSHELSSRAWASGPDVWRPRQADMASRSLNDYDLCQPRFGEQNADLALEWMGIFGGGNKKKPLDQALTAEMKISVDLAKKWIGLREQSKHEAIRALWPMRKAMLDASKRMGAIGNEAFHADPEQVEAWAHSSWPSGALIELISRRDADLIASQWVMPKFPLPISSAGASKSIFSFGWFSKEKAAASVNIKSQLISDRQARQARQGASTEELWVDSISMALAGRPEASSVTQVGQASDGAWEFVSGFGPVKGPWLQAMPEWGAQRLSDELSSLPHGGRGYVVGCRAIKPQWVAPMSEAGVACVCAEVGSWLSHPAVLARESELPVAIGGRPDVFKGDVYTVNAKK